MKTLIRVLVVILLVLVLAIAGVLGFMWYRNNHIFVEDAVYPIDSQYLDLREEDISFEHYESVRAQLPECEIRWMVPFHGGKYANDTQSLQISALTFEDVEILVRYFPKLKTLDASECDQYDVLAAAEEALPDCEVRYSVYLGGPVIDHNAATLITGFSEDDDFEILKANLTYLPKLQTLKLTDPALSMEQMEELCAAYPQITITRTVGLLGQEYEADTTELNLSAISSADVAAVVEKLPLLPNLTHLELMAEDGTSQLTKEDVKTLMEAVPGAVINYSFDFFGNTLSTADEEVHIKNTKIGDEGLPEVRAALDLLTNCKRFVLENCQISNENMAQLREDYRDRTKVVWRISFGRGTTMTDAQIIRAVYDLSDKNCKNLIYCEDARFIDFGHNGDDGNYLHDCSYVAGMPNLEACILSSAYISDLSAFENCKKLKFLEITYCGMVNDISPLAGCESLEMLNISFTGVTDLSPLDKLPITHLCAMNYSNKRISQEEQERFQALHPGCWSQYVGEQPYGPGWRYTEDGKDYLPYYRLLSEVFQYPIFPRTPNHVGWYLDEEDFQLIEEVHAAIRKNAEERTAAATSAVAAVEETEPEETIVEETLPEETTEETTPTE